MEEGGTLGAHALALLKQLAEFAAIYRVAAFALRIAVLLSLPQCRFRFGCSAGSISCPVSSMSPSLSSCYAAHAPVHHPDGALSAVLS